MGTRIAPTRARIETGKAPTRALRALAAAAALALPCAGAAADLAVPGRTPEGTLAIVSVPDAKGMWAGLSRTPLWKALEQRAYEGMAGGSANALIFKREMPKIEEAIGLPLLPDRLFSEEGIRGFDVYLLPPVQQPGGLRAPVVAVLAFHNPQAPGRILDHLKNEVRGAEGETVGDTSTILSRTALEGVEVWSFRGFELHVAALPSVLVVGNTQSSVYAALDGRGGATTVQSQAFRRSFASLDALPHQMWVFGDGRSILQAATEIAQLPAQELTQGRAFVERDFAFIGDFQSDHVKFTQFTPTEVLTSTERGMQALTQPSARGFATAAYLPADSLVATSINNFNGTAMLDLMLAALEENTATAPQAAQTRASIGNISRTGGFSVQDDFLANIGSDVSLALTEIKTSPGAMPPVTGDALIAATLADEAKMRETMVKVEELIGSQLSGMAAGMSEGSTQMVMATSNFFRDEAHGAETLRVLDSNQFGPVGDFLKTAGFSPAYTITTDGRMIVALKSASIKTALDAAAGRVASQATSDPGQRANRLLSPTRNSSSTMSLAAFGKLVDDVVGMLPGTLEGESAEMLPFVTGLLRSAGVLVAAENYDENGLTREFLLLM
ncbi:MAG: hypothetical protein SF028_11405 [Candidatus Sumerlaeia bacterium]|nr:hypothetical protein [Candidatus Sumerlaeia bacterium]